MITNIMDLSPSVKQLTLSTNIDFSPGQWVDFVIPGALCTSLLRPNEDYLVGGFSLTSTPKRAREDREVELMVKSSPNRPVKWVHEMAREGDQVMLRAGGAFTCNIADMRVPVVLLSAGIGS